MHNDPQVLDALAREQARREREAYVAELFRPMYHEDGYFKTKWLVEDFIPADSLVLIAGNPKVGKTSFASALALAVATGIPFAGRNVEQGAVLWIAAEESPAERNEIMRQSPIADASTPIYTSYQPLNVDDHDDLEAIREWVVNVGAKLIVVDPLIGSIHGRSLQDSWSARRSLQALKRFCNFHQVSAIVLHHQKRDRFLKKNAVADSSQLAATASMNIVLSCHEGLPIGIASSLPCTDRVSEASCGGGTEGGGAVERNVRKSKKARNPNPETRNPTRLVRLECEGRGAWANGTILLMSDGPLDYRPTVPTRVTRQVSKPLSFTELLILEAMAKVDSLTSNDLIESVGIPAGTVRNCITNLRRRGLILRFQVQNGEKRYEITQEGRLIAESQELQELRNQAQKAREDYEAKNPPKKLTPDEEDEMKQRMANAERRRKRETKHAA